MAQVEFPDVTGDAAVRVTGADLADLFRGAAEGLYRLITASAVSVEKQIDIIVSGDGPETLLIRWLNELIYLFDTESFIGAVVDVRSVTAGAVVARVSGDTFDPAVHERGLLVKAATYHRLKIEQTAGLWRAEIIFDI